MKLLTTAGIALALSLLCTPLASFADKVNTAALTSHARPVVTIESGPVKGISKNNSHFYLGIPYAKPPIGELRWQPPQAPHNWSEALDASSYGLPCPQQPVPGLGLDLGETSENCLTINVIAPAKIAAGEKLPVLFSIHGGGFMMGSGAMSDMGSSAYLNPAGIIAVNFNYRLGALGFFAHPQLDASHGNNYGLMDMLAALRWVNKNIAQFGGDPERVTIQGISAGAQGVLMLMVNPDAHPLFNGAIAQSSYGGFPGQPRNKHVRPLAGSPAAEKLGVAIVSRALATTDNTAPDGNINGEQLFALAPEQLTRAITSFHLPIIDGKTLPEETTVMFGRGQQNAVPFIGGNTSFDGSVMAASGSSTDFLLNYVNNRQAFETLYQEDLAISEKQALMRMFGDVRYAFSGWAAARFMKNVDQPGYNYRFDYVPPAQRDSLPGAPHGSDGRLFATPGIAATETMRGYWINFIKTGNPNGDGLPEWTTASDGNADNNTAVMVLDEKARLVPGLGKAKMELLQQRWSQRVEPLMQENSQ